LIKRTLGRSSTRKALMLIAPAAVLAAFVAVGPSFAGSFLTHKEAVKTFIKRTEAAATYLNKDDAASTYLSQKDAGKTLKGYVPAATAPIFRGAASSVPVGPIFSTTPFMIPNARLTYQTESTTNLLATFSAQTQCTADTNGLGCPIQFVIDGQAGPKMNLGTASTATPAAAADTHTVSQVGVVTPGKHTVEIRYAGVTGAANASIGFKILSWNIAVQAYPDPVDEEATDEG
jgi:hypothetical protein